METPSKTYALVESAASKKIIAELASNGARVLRFPPIEFGRIAPNERASALLKDLTAFDWLVISDVFAAEFFIETLEESGFDFCELDAVRICALGESVADRLRFAQIHADVVPVSVETGASVTALAAYIGEREMAGKKFLVVKKCSSAAEIEKTLAAKGAVVSAIEIYRAAISARTRSEDARLKTLAAGGAIDEFVFAAPADFFALDQFFKGALKDILSDAQISALDSVTLQFLHEHSLNALLFRS